MNHLLLLLILGTSLSNALASHHNEPMRSQQVEPKIRVLDRDWSYFESLSCSVITNVEAHSRPEEILIAKRKKQCVEKYKAFLPQPVDS